MFNCIDFYNLVLVSEMQFVFEFIHNFTHSRWLLRLRLFLYRGNPDTLRDKVLSYRYLFSGLNLMSSRDRLLLAETWLCGKHLLLYSRQCNTLFINCVCYQWKCNLIKNDNFVSNIQTYNFLISFLLVSFKHNGVRPQNILITKIETFQQSHH